MLAGLILAGGEGTRWGGPKAWAKLPDGRTFLEACTACLADAGCVPIVATLPPESDDPGIERLAALALPERGLDMFASFVIGLEELVRISEWQRLVVVPVDHPLVRPSTARALALKEGPAVIPSYRGKHGHPICIDRSTAEAVVRRKLEGPTIRDVLREVGSTDLAVADPGVIANCNTPEALESAWGAMSGSGSTQDS